MKENRNKILLALLAILVIANITLLVLFLRVKGSDKQQHNRQDRKAYITAFLKKDIGFSDVQLAIFDTMSDNHRQRVSAIIDKEKTGRPEQFKQLVAANFSDSVMNVLAEKSAAIQKITDAMMFAHIKNIRLLCTPQQLPAFDSLFGKVLNRRGGGDGKRKTP